MTPTPAKGPSPSDQKLQRWIDVVACLLRRHYGATFDQLRAEVPAYAQAQKQETLMRMFERDKDELREFGIPITVLDADDGESVRYRLDAREMYLPYIVLASADGHASAAHDGQAPGYRAIPTLTFEPDELRALVDGIRAAISIGDDAITADAESALRKLTWDLDAPLGTILGDAEDALLAPREPATSATVRLLGHALLRRKRVRFTYRSMSSDETAGRDVEPYGLFFSSGHWYLAGRDVAKGDVRNFRVSRMDAVETNRKKPQATDYDIPCAFQLAEHARAKEAWELGDGEAREMVVDFTGDTGAARAAASLGAPTSNERRRVFEVRRLDSFARWLLSFGGEAVPVSPPELVSAYRDIGRATRAVYVAEKRA